MSSLGLYYSLWQHTHTHTATATACACATVPPSKETAALPKGFSNEQAMLIQASSTKQKEDLRTRLEDMEESDTPGFLELLKDFAKEFLVRILHQLELELVILCSSSWWMVSEWATEWVNEFSRSLAASVLLLVRSPSTGRGIKRRQFDFTKVVKMDSKGSRSESGTCLKPMTRREFVAWWTAQCPGYKRDLTWLVTSDWTGLDCCIAITILLLQVSVRELLKNYGRTQSTTRRPQRTKSKPMI